MRKHVFCAVYVRANDFAAHGRLCGVDEAFLAERIDLDGHLVGNELAGHLGSQTVAGDNGRRVNLVLDQLVGALQKLGGDDHDRSRTVTDLAVLLLRQLDQHFARRVLHFEKLENGGAIVADRDILK